MNDADKLKEKIIDNYYEKKDTAVKVPSNYKEDLEDFETKLHRTLEAMDSLEKLDFDIDVNFLEIIDTADKIKEGKKGIFEVFAFIICSFLIISSGVFVTIFFQTKVILYFEAAVALLLPFSLIPLAGHYRTKEEL